MAMHRGDDDDLSDVDRDILDIIPERFDADADSRLARRSAHTRIILTISLAVLAVMALGVAARHILFGDAPRDRQLSVPVVHADDKPIKVKPQDRGGMDVPNQDKLIYDRMAAKGGGQQPEQLLPPPEQAQLPPAPEPHPPVPAKSDMPNAGDAMPPPASKPALTPPTATQAPAPAMTAALPQSQPMPAKAPPAVAKPVALPPPPPVAPSAPATPSAKTGGWVVQLGSLQSESDAKAEWLRLKNSHKDLLGDLSSDILRVDLGAKGIYWRVRGGPLDEAQARILCAELAKQSQGCIIARK